MNEKVKEGRKAIKMSDPQTGKIYTAFPEGYYKRKINFDRAQQDPGGAVVETRIDFHPEIQINPDCFSYSAEIKVNSSMFEVVLFLYQRVDFPGPLNLKKYLNDNPECIKEVMRHSVPHASMTIHQLILNMGFKTEEGVIKDQISNCISKLRKAQVH